MAPAPRELADRATTRPPRLRARHTFRFARRVCASVERAVSFFGVQRSSTTHTCITRRAAQRELVVRRVRQGKLGPDSSQVRAHFVRKHSFSIPWESCQGCPLSAKARAKAERAPSASFAGGESSLSLSLSLLSRLRESRGEILSRDDAISVETTDSLWRYTSFDTRSCA